MTRELDIWVLHLISCILFLALKKNWDEKGINLLHQVCSLYTFPFNRLLTIGMRKVFLALKFLSIG